jgi:hypothetical protein
LTCEVCYIIRLIPNQMTFRKYSDKTISAKNMIHRKEYDPQKI